MEDFFSRNMRNRLTTKIFKIFLSFSFAIQPLPFAHAQKGEESIHIPAHLGTIERLYTGSPEKVIYLIRDLHAHEEAQRQEIAILKWLQRKTKLEWILTEGAEGPLNTALLKTLSFD